jgi:hypothetical protein
MVAEAMSTIDLSLASTAHQKMHSTVIDRQDQYLILEVAQ